MKVILQAKDIPDKSIVRKIDDAAEELVLKYKISMEREVFGGYFETKTYYLINDDMQAILISPTMELIWETTEENLCDYLLNKKEKNKNETKQENV